MDNIEIWKKALNLFYETSITSDTVPMNADLININVHAPSLREKFEEEVYKELDACNVPEKFLKDIKQSFDSVCDNYIFWYEKHKPSWRYYKEFLTRVNETQTFLNRLSNKVIHDEISPQKHGAAYAVKYYEQLKKVLKVSDNPSSAVRQFNPKLDNKEVKAVSKKFWIMLKRDGHDYPWRNL